MTRRFSTLLTLVLFSLSMMVFTACHDKPKVEEPGNGTMGENGGTRGMDDGAGRPGDPDPGELAQQVQRKLVKIYFDFDKSNIRADQQERMEQNAKVLLANPQVNVTIEGHCDERGTTEYNFALGERRANSVRRFLISRGVDAQRLTILSKGEEEPVVDRDTEEAYALNRRCEFIVTK
ncbi:MAG: peptidoglycan-associated lipoprotein Pal [Candidatus Sumerlaeia bacterium]